MKKVLFATTIGLFVSGTAYAQGPATPSTAPAVFAAKIQFSAGYAKSSIDPSVSPFWDESYPTIAGDGRVSVPLGRGWSFQADVSGSKNFVDSSTFYSFPGGFNTTGHVSYRDGRNFLAGIYGGFGQVSANFIFPTDTFVTGGAEGQVHFGPATLYAQGGYASVSSDSDTFDMFVGPKSAYYGRLIGRYFFADDSYLQAEGTYGSGDVDVFGSGEITFAGWGARYERHPRFTSLPLNYFIEYRGTRASWDVFGYKEKQHAFMLGASLRFGGVSNRENDLKGVTLEPTEDVYQVMGLTARFFP